MLDLAKYIGGSALGGFRGMVLETKDGIATDFSLDTFDVPVDGLSDAADKRVKAQGFKITLTPAGKWVNPDRLYPLLNAPLGSFVVPIVPVQAVNLHGAGANPDTLLLDYVPFYAGDRVMVSPRPEAVLPTASTPLDTTAWYWVSLPAVGLVKLHLTQADALAGTNPLQFTAAGEGEFTIIGQFPLVINSVDGEQITFHSTALTAQPDYNGSAEQTPFGKVEFTVFLRQGKDLDDEDAFFSTARVPFPGWTLSAEDIKTQAQSVSWANQLGFAPTAITAAQATLTVAAHGRTTGEKVYFSTSGALPGANPAINPRVPLYVHKLTDGTFTLHATSADAATGDDAVTFTSQGTGVHLLTVSNPPVSFMDTKVGISAKFPVKLEAVTDDKHGIVNQRLTDASAEVSFIPIGLGSKDVLSQLKTQGAGVVRGRSLAAGSKPLNIFSPGMFVRVNGAALTKGGLAHNVKDGRAAEMTFSATRQLVGGAMPPLATIGTVAPLGAA